MAVSISGSGHFSMNIGTSDFGTSIAKYRAKLGQWILSEAKHEEARSEGESAAGFFLFWCRLFVFFRVEIFEGFGKRFYFHLAFVRLQQFLIAVHQPKLLFLRSR